jgi:flagellar protein FliO/FliZ
MDFDLSTPMRVIIALFLVVAVIGLVVWLVRRFSGERISGAATRGRQPRLAVIDAAAVDGRRRLVLIRRDNVEHLMMIGGPTDVVVEANIVRAAPAREPVPPRPPAAAESRAVALGEGTMWPLQPEPSTRPEPMSRPEPVAKAEPSARAEPAPRPQRPPPLAEEPAQWAEAEPAAPPSPPLTRERRPRAADPLVGLAQELARAPAPEEAPAADQPARQPPRREPRAGRPQPPNPSPTAPQSPADALFNPAADQNLAEMAQRLEAALRRPARNDEARSAQPAAKTEPAAAETEAEPPTSREAARPARGDARSARGADAPAPQKSLYDSLEQEMASLLGRPGSKP